jgi:diguanylate cyclase
MSVEDVTQSRSIADSAIGTMERFEIPATPANYAIWYEYHAGLSPNLKRTIDVLISNHTDFNEGTLQELYATFFSSAKEAVAVRDISVHALQTLQEIASVADLASDDAHQFGHALRGFASKGLGEYLGNLKNLIENLVEESKSMAGRSEFVGLRMRESAGKIEALERNLENAILDSTLDGLTGVSNRRSFDATIRTLAGDAMNSGDDLAMLMIDIDHFKKVNDTWGHPTGDIVLRHLARILQKSVRGGDHVARYGGEEFAVLLPRTDAQAAVSVAENIRVALAREPLLLELDPPMTPITVSIGAACYDPGEPLAEWVGRADVALYSAKKDGRDRVELN